jgi:hypothetical protein
LTSAVVINKARNECQKAILLTEAAKLRLEVLKGNREKSEHALARSKETSEKVHSREFPSSSQVPRKTVTKVGIPTARNGAPKLKRG